MLDLVDADLVVSQDESFVFINLIFERPWVAVF